MVAQMPLSIKSFLYFLTTTHYPRYTLRALLVLLALLFLYAFNIHRTLSLYSITGIDAAVIRWITLCLDFH